jgi:hypothetical protein
MEHSAHMYCISLGVGKQSESIYTLTKLGRQRRIGSYFDQIGNYVILLDQIGSWPGVFESRTNLNVLMVGRCAHTIYRAG